jgi:insulysin
VFPEALDIFSQFFKEPLFTEEATEREMNAVDSEFRRNLSNEARRMV